MSTLRVRSSSKLMVDILSERKVTPPSLALIFTTYSELGFKRLI